MQLKGQAKHWHWYHQICSSLEILVSSHHVATNIISAPPRFPGRSLQVPPQIWSAASQIYRLSPCKFNVVIQCYGAEWAWPWGCMLSCAAMVPDAAANSGICKKLLDVNVTLLCVCRCQLACLPPAQARLMTGGSASCSSRSSEPESTSAKLSLVLISWTRMLDGQSGKRSHLLCVLLRKRYCYSGNSIFTQEAAL